MTKLNKTEITSIIQAIQNGIKEDYIDFKKSNSFSTYNCKNFLKWDLIYTNISSKILKESFKTVKMNRKIWEFVTIIHEPTNTLYIVTRKKNFLKLQSERVKRNIPHYIDGFATINNTSSQYEQLELFDVSKKFDEKQINDILQLLGEYKDKIKQFCVIVFEEAKGDLIGIENYLVDSKLNVVDSIDWSTFIKPHFDIEEEYEYTVNDEDISEQVVDSNIDIEIRKKDKNIEKNVQ